MAYVTLVANNFYLPGCVALINSLHNVHTSYKIYVIVTRHVDPRSTDYIYITQYAEIIIVDDWPDDIHSLDKMGAYKLGNNTNVHIHKPSEFNPNNNFLKLRLWELFDKTYKKMVYLDADVIVLQNIDHLLSCFQDIPFAAACDINKDDMKKIEKLNSGVFLFTPSKETYQKMLEMYRDRISNGIIFDRTDQSLLEEYFSDWNHLSASYNTVWWRHLVLPININKIKILHFTMQKPWDEKETFPTEMKQMVEIWKSHYHTKCDPLWYCFDYDGTLTPNDSAEIPSRIISLLNDLKHNRKKKICIVTGRGFAFARTFIDILPIDAVICENGALVYEKIGQEVKMVAHEDALHNHFILNILSDEYKSAISSDQHCRTYDVAIDLKKLKNESQVQDLENFCKNQGLYYSRSNIHINIWKGKYNKLIALEGFLGRHKQYLRFRYFGDSPNDSCIFSAYPYNCVAMKNIRDYKDAAAPSIITNELNCNGVIETIGTRILIDLDNTIADWDGELFRQLPDLDRSKRVTNWCIYKCFPENINEIQQVICKAGFYENLPPIPNAIESVKALSLNGYSICFVTAPPENNIHAIPDKISWIRKHFGNDFVSKLIFTSQKHMVDGDILIDDKVYDMKSNWIQIVYAQPYNEGKFTWERCFDTFNINM